MESDAEQPYARMNAAQNRKKRKSGGWQSMGLDHGVLNGVIKKGYQVPTPIQRKAIPVLLGGKDILAMSRTGSGKTAAFLVPMFQKLKTRTGKAGFRALLISPTRELALQTFKFCRELGKYTQLRSVLVVGGEGLERQFGNIHENPDIVIGTPGRLLHVILEMDLKLTEVEYVVFDEGDRLFEMGFTEQLNEVLHRLPDSRQTALFSATLPKMLVDFAKAGLRDPVLIRLDVETKISEKLRMSFLSCRTEDKLAIYLHLLRHQIDVRKEQTIVFCATKHFVDLVHEVTIKAGFSSTYIYSDLDADARVANMNKFRHHQCCVLIVTDVAARGVDIPFLDNVINFHFPSKAKLFIHRVGRAARAGNSGVAYSLLGPDEVPYLVDLCLFLGDKLRFASNQFDVRNQDRVLGAVPQTLIDDEHELLHPIINSGESTMEDQRRLAANSMKQYARSRPQASVESVRRVKRDLRSDLESLNTHPMFRTALTATAETGTGNESVVLKESAADIMHKLKNYRSVMTVFEMNSSNRQAACAVMKAKRKAHGKYVHSQQQNEVTQAHDQLLIETDHGQVANLVVDEDPVTEEHLQSVFSDTIPASKPRIMKMKRPVKKEKESRRDADHFVSYQPSDFHAEKGLAVSDNFEQQARDAVVDFTADDNQEMNKQKAHGKTWDRKRKRFVGDAGNTGKAKRVKTDDGRWVPANMKTGAYEKWLKNKGNTAEGGDHSDNEDNPTNFKGSRGSRGRGGMARSRGGARGRRFYENPTDSSRGQNKKELKSKEQILKHRKQKEGKDAYMKHRIQSKRGGGGGGAPSRGRGGPMRGRGGGRGGSGGRGGRGRR